MPVISINLKEIDARRIEDLIGGIKINNNTSVRDIKETELIGLERKGLSISFDYKTEYVNEKNKKFAEINISGDVFFVDDAQEKILKDWKKEKRLPDEVNLQIINTILRKCSTKALTISEELNLPPPIALPFASKKEESKETSRYIG